MRKPNLFLVGQPKSGTTALDQFLGEHPDIFMAKIKCPNYFCKDFHRESDSFHKSQLFFDVRDENEYLKLFSRASSQKIIGETSDHALSSEVAASEIHKFNPEAKIIILLREPLSFLYSLHNYYLNYTNEDEEDFSKALLLESSRIKGELIPPRTMCPSWLYYSKRVNYYEQVKRFYDKFGLSQIKIIIYEDFLEKNHHFFREISRFLGVDTSFSPQYCLVNTSKDIRFKQLNSIVNNPKLKYLSRKLFSQRFNEIVRDKIVAKLLLKESSRSSLPIKIREQLMQKFKPEVLKMSQLLGVDLEQKWGYDKL
ncbi:MAG: sulfotransferase [Xenococcaceae cyanobacterium MO_188.B32]|nr:sulfotransferase [Xenococcaceae cyanobacterium MO_188.B32]